MREALVTGGGGFIGSHLVDRLVSDGWSVKILDNFSSGRMENIARYSGNSCVKVLNVDLKNLQDIYNNVKDVDVVFHYAANPEVRVSTTNPDIHFNENIVATFNLLEAMRKNNVGEIVFASSSSVYGEPEVIPVGEDAPLKPVSVYGASKAACESLMHAYSRLYGIRAVVLRYANVVGPRLRHGVIHDLIMKLRGDPCRLEILGDGTQSRSYIYIDDAVEATITAHMKSKGYFEVFNVSSEGWITVKDVADIIVEVMGLENVEYIFKPVLHGVGWPGDVKRIALKIDKLKGLGFKPLMNSREAVKRTAGDLIREISFR
jgi:UDP-glucose 4-epimerase